jgi:Mat/Ecp fimbriae major subunit
MQTAKMILIGLVVIALVALAVPSFAAGNVGATAEADLLTALSISKTTDLDFGAMIAGGAGTAIIAADSGGARTGTHTMLVAQEPGVAAKFRVTGSNARTFAITLTQPVGGVLKTGDGTGVTKQISVLLARDAATGTLSSGVDDIYVGGTLTVEAEDIAGEYTGSFDVAVAYN